MTEQNIPAEKVRELADKYDNAPGNPDRLLVNAIADLRALLPTPPQPTSGLLGRWAKHDAYGDLVVISNRTDKQGDVWVSYIADSEPDGMDCNQVRIDSLTFPEQATKPEDVPAGEAWRVDVEYSEESHKSIVALKDSFDFWRTSDEVTTSTCWNDSEVTLIAPLTPERPVSDLQAKYDALDAKYWEAQEKIAELKEAITSRTVTTKAEYEALPDGSVVAQPGELDVYIKNDFGVWDRLNTTASFPSLNLAGTTRTVLRYGWGDEQLKPAWRIEHDHTNLRVGEYIIDCVDDYGTVEYIDETGTRYTDGNALGKPQYSPFIAFLNRDAATPEAVAEAKRARDKEMDK